MISITLPNPDRRPVPLPSEEGHSKEPTGEDASSLIKYSMLIMLCACVLVYPLSVLLGQESAWPLRNISQYAAHVPAVYFFRVAGIATGTLLVQAGLLLRRRASWASLLVPTGICSAGAVAVSHTEDNVLHTVFALLFLFGLANVEACAAWADRHHHPLFRSSGPPPWPRFWGAGAAYSYFGFATVLCAYAFGLDRQVRTARARLRVPHPRATSEAHTEPPPAPSDRTGATHDDCSARVERDAAVYGLRISIIADDLK